MSASGWNAYVNIFDGFTNRAAQSAGVTDGPQLRSSTRDIVVPKSHLAESFREKRWRRAVVFNNLDTFPSTSKSESSQNVYILSRIGAPSESKRGSTEAGTWWRNCGFSGWPTREVLDRDISQTQRRTARGEREIHCRASPFVRRRQCWYCGRRGERCQLRITRLY